MFVARTTISTIGTYSLKTLPYAAWLIGFESWFEGDRRIGPLARRWHTSAFSEALDGIAATFVPC
jgi:hypothetical protein